MNIAKINKKKALRVIEIILLIAALCFAGSAINSYYQEYKQAQFNEQLRQQIERQEASQTQTEAQTSAPVEQHLLESLREINSDTVAWLDVEGMPIKYPIVQAADNDYYLQNNFQRESSKFGAIFMDFRNDPLFQDFNTIVYGHTFPNSDEMFAAMRLLRDQNYWQDHNIITVMLDDRYYKYKIFSVYATEADFDYRTPNYRVTANAERFLREITERSEIDSGVTPALDDKILTLSTCTYDFNNARLALHAVLLEERDAENSLVMYNDRQRRQPVKTGG